MSKTSSWIRGNCRFSGFKPGDFVRYVPSWDPKAADNATVIRVEDGMVLIRFEEGLLGSVRSQNLVHADPARALEELSDETLEELGMI